MFNSGAIKECILNPENTADIHELMEQGGVQYGMQTFDQSIMSLYKQGLISFEEAMNQASNPDDFDLRLRGITGSSERWQDSSSDGPIEADSPDSLDSSSDFKKY